MELRYFPYGSRPEAFRDTRMGGSSDDGTGFGEDLDVSSSSFDSEFEITEGEEMHEDESSFVLCEELKLLSFSCRAKRSARQIRSQPFLGLTKYIPAYHRKRSKSGLLPSPLSLSTSRRAEFDDLCEGVKRDILSRLPAASVLSNRSVNCEWSRILSSDRFLTNEWAKNRPDEKWIFLHNPNRPEVFLFYDPTYHQWRYKSLPGPGSFLTNMTSKSLATAGGLVYALGRGAGALFVKVCNPLTGEVSTFPFPVTAQNSNSSLSILITEHKKTGSYGILVQDYALRVDGPDPRLLGNVAGHYEMIISPTRKFSLYSSDNGLWLDLPDIKPEIIPGQESFVHLHLLQRFRYEDGQLCFYPMSVVDCIHKGNVVWLDIQSQQWTFHLPINWIPAESSRINKLLRRKCLMKIFERDGELILVTIVRNFRSTGLEIWTRSLSRSENDDTLCWRRLDILPRRFASLLVTTTEPEYRVTRRFRRPKKRSISETLSNLLFFPLGDKVHGDKLLIMNAHNFNTITFDFADKPGKQRWKFLGSPTIPNFSDTYNCCRFLKELSELWTKGFCQACIFEPRLDAKP
ncbi:hypothetical protein MPTK2_8g05320 [Marchantia polymorpha subsp. ruderalis]